VYTLFTPDLQETGRTILVYTWFAPGLQDTGLFPRRGAFRTLLDPSPPTLFCEAGSGRPAGLGTDSPSMRVRRIVVK
jgi:hypothetical protein